MTNQSEILLESMQAGIRMACPFCHSYSTLLVDEEHDPHPVISTFVECFTCGAQGPHMKGGEAAVDAWQGRTP